LLIWINGRALQSISIEASPLQEMFHDAAWPYLESTRMPVTS